MTRETSGDSRNREQQSTTHGGSAEVWAGRQASAGYATSQLDDWLSIAPDGTVTVFSGKVELGTGVRTALAQIVADELDVPMTCIRMVMGDTAQTPNEGYTAGSRTLQMGGTALRQAAAEARRALCEMAADLLSVSLDALAVRDGRITVANDPSRGVTYGDLMGSRRFDRTITGTAPLKLVEDYRVVGSNVARMDLLPKFTGQPAYVHDLRLAGMLHARIVRPPSLGATVASLDESAVRDAQVIRLGDFLAVVAEHEEHAIRAAKQLVVRWHETASLPPMGELWEVLRQQPATDRVLVQSGDVDTRLALASPLVHATYFQPFQSHATVGPSCAVADFHDGEVTVWCGSQGVYPLRAALADLFEVPIERVHVIHMESAGVYGQTGADDVAADAAVLSRELEAPVRVQWSREDEFVWEPKGPAMVMEVRGGLDEQGNIAVWDYQVWTPTHANRPRAALDFLAGQLIRRQPRMPGTVFLGGERNAPTNYTLPHSRVTLHGLTKVPLRSSSLRTLGATANTFANESFMDELAVAGGRDPVEFRLQHVVDQRARDVITAAARQARWGTALPPGHGRGIAFARYENEEAYVATVAEVKVDENTGAVRVRRVVVAHDCGLIVNPDGVRNQIEGNIIQSLSRALLEEVRFDEYRITTRDWQSYPILTFSDIPEIEIVLINRPDQPAVGAGEPATITTAPAVANAIYTATGARVRQVPFTPARIRAALPTSRQGAEHDKGHGDASAS
ncbi:MAG: molybdopterin cofactor-binding domain-containing protein [Ktedonobacterales bacterium]